MGTNVEATPYREIPTDGIAVLGMTYFFQGCVDSKRLLLEEKLSPKVADVV